MTALQALVGFALWTLALITLVFLYRGLRFLRGTPINHWPRGNKPQDDASLVKRLEDAHANAALFALDIVDTRADLIPLEKIMEGDEYLFLRDVYLQRREFLVHDGQVKDTFMDDFGDDENSSPAATGAGPSTP